MRKFNVRIKETLEKVVEVEASCRNEAISIAKINYHNQDPILDASNFTGVEFTIPREREHEFAR
jgi:hypothetical protein